MTRFEELGLSPWLLESCEAFGMKEATPVQAAAVPAVLGGKNVLASAETGTGKTAAFVLPILQRLAEDPFGIFAIILEPTRELALQVYETAHALGARKGVRVESIVGGVDMVQQGLALSRRPHIVVSTPGRLADYVRRDDVDLSRVRFVVLDEADRLLESCFDEDLTDILGACNPEKRQTLLFTATVSRALEKLADEFSDDVFRFDAKALKYQTVERLKQEFYVVPEDFKDCYLVHLLLAQFLEEPAVVFVMKKSTCELLLYMLRELGVKCCSLHSGMKQSERESTLASFKSSSVKVLIATDLAARGLDVPAVGLVVNYDIPDRASIYVHRVGRTARIGRSGVAISLVSQYDLELVQNIEKKLGRTIATRENAVEVEKEIMKDHLSKVTQARRLARLAMAQTAGKLLSSVADTDKRTRPTKRKRKTGGATG